MATLIGSPPVRGLQEQPADLQLRAGLAAAGSGRQPLCAPEQQIAVVSQTPLVQKLRLKVSV